MRLTPADLIDLPLGYAAMHMIDGPAQGPGFIDVEGSISATPATLASTSLTVLDDGCEIQVDCCVQCAFRMAANTSVDYNLSISAYGPGTATTLCPSSTGTAPSITGAGLIYDAIGGESQLSACIDPFSLGEVSFPDRVLLANGSLTNTAPAPPIEQIVNTLSGTGTATLTFGTTTASVIVPNAAVPLWTVNRAGMTAARTDTWDTATNIEAAINNSVGAGSFVSVGQIYRLRVCNQSNFTETLSGGGSVTVQGQTLVTPGSCTNFALDITNTATPAVLIVGG